MFDNEISKNEFVEYALDHKLLDAREANERRKKKEKEDRIDRLAFYKRQSSFAEETTNNQPSHSLLCCIRSGESSSSRSPVREVQAATKEMVEVAFRKFDRNGDGVLDWEEFQQVGLL